MYFRAETKLGTITYDLSIYKCIGMYVLQSNTRGQENFYDWLVLELS